MTDINKATRIGEEEGAKARSELCAVCVSKLNSRITKLDLLRGPGHVMKKMEGILCPLCQEKIIQAGVRGSRRY